MIYTYYGRAKMEIRTRRTNSNGDSYPLKPKSLFLKDGRFHSFTYGSILKSIKLIKGKNYFITADKLGRIKSIKISNSL